MNTLSKDGPLTDAEFDRLADFLEECEGGMAMNLEELDGMFSALIAGPELVPPSEYLPEIFGGEMSEFSSIEQANEILGLILRHWNGIAETLNKGDVHCPFLLEDENGLAPANEWAHGFMLGVTMRSQGWAEALDDTVDGGWLLPAMILDHEHDEDPELRSPPISPEQRSDLIAHMAAGIVLAYRHFRPQRERPPMSPRTSTQRSPAKAGRNDPCPCGSGKKYKRCCGGPLIH